MSERIKTLTLKRAVYPSGAQTTLEDVFRRIFERTETYTERVLKLDLLKDAVIAKLEQSPQNSGIFVRIHEYEEGAIGSINFRAASGGIEIEGVEPPTGQNFLHEDLGLFIVENNVIACGMANKNKIYATQISELAERLGIISENEHFSLVDVPNQSNLIDLKETGVREIQLGVSDYLASLPGGTDLKSRVMNAIWATPSDPNELKHRQENHGKLVLKRGRFKKDEIKYDQWLTNVGREIVAADDQEYKIILEDERVLTSTNLKMVKTVRIKRQYNTVNWVELRLQLEKFYKELRDGSLL